MNFSPLLRRARAIFFSLLPLAALGQPPAQGPGLPGPGNSKEFGMFVVLNGFELTVQKVLDSANARIDSLKGSSGIGAHLSFDYKAFKPYLTETTYPDRPNDKIVRMSLIVTYHVTGISYHSIPYFSRDISQSVDIFGSCQNWSTNNGTPTIRIVGQQPYLDGNSFGEDALNFFCANIISNYVDGALRSQLGGFQSGSAIATLAPCNCINALDAPDDTQNNHYKGSSIDFGYNPPSRRVITGMGGIVAGSNETITLTSVKRLPAHDLHGGIIYQPEENVTLILYVNQALKVVNLGPMHENDVAPVSNVKFVFPKPTTADNTVVLIANIQQSDGILTTNTGWEVFKKANNFGNGLQTLTVNKSYWQQPVRVGGGHVIAGSNKPYQVFVGAYALTLNVDYPTTVLTQ